MVTAINNKKELQEKEFLQKINIRTMKKDLLQLRKTNSLQEKEKISEIKMPMTKSSSTLDEIGAVKKADAKQNLNLRENEPLNSTGDKLGKTLQSQVNQGHLTELEQNIKEESVEASQKKIQTDLKEKNNIQSQKQIVSVEIKEKEYLKEVPLAAKEKLAKSAETEEKQRKKFIEDVEKWAEEKKDDNNNINI